jgi:hypothetical protein
MTYLSSRQHAPQALVAADTNLLASYVVAKVGHPFDKLRTGVRLLTNTKALHARAFVFATCISTE